MQIGNFQVDLVTLGHFRMDGGGLFGIIPRKLWQRVFPDVDAENRVLLAARALLVQGNGVVLVADAGLGEKLDEKQRAIFCVDQPADALTMALAAHGVHSDSVTHFVYTHLHFDHAGGATRIAGDGSIQPVFPNARHYVQREHLAWAESPSDKDKASFNPDNWRPVQAAGQLEIVDGEAEPLHGITLMPVHGHTPAMQMVHVQGKGDAYVYTIDLFPTAAHLPPHYIAAFDNYPLLVLEEKKQLLAKAAANNWQIGFGHDPKTTAITVQQKGTKYETVQTFPSE